MVNRIVLVTGGGSGLGKALAARFRAAGDSVIITGRDPGRLATRTRVHLVRRGQAALAAWTAGLSAQVGPRGLSANLISPGYTAGTGFFRGTLTAQRRAALIDATHDGRAGQPGDIAETAYFLASAGARHITGQTLHVNGGAHTTRWPHGGGAHTTR